MKKQTEIINFLENLHFLLKSGLPIVSCLDILAKKTKNLKILDLKTGILNGKNFKDSLSSIFNSKVPQVIDIFIQIGESCGNLSEMISKAIETDKQIKKINSSFIGAVSYPLFICFVALVMMFLTMIGIVPKLLPMFRDLHVDLPVYTRFFIATSNFILNFGGYTLLVIGALIWGLIFLFKRTQKFRIFIENIVLKMWIIRDVYIRYQTSIIALCISQYLNAGYVFHDAIKMVGKSIRSFAYNNACCEISRDSQNGENMISTLELHQKLMPDWSYVLDLASQTGRLAHQFERFYLENLEYLDKLNTKIKRWSEPALMLFIGGIIAIFAISIISPIYSVVQNVRI